MVLSELLVSSSQMSLRNMDLRNNAGSFARDKDEDEINKHLARKDLYYEITADGWHTRQSLETTLI